MDDFIATCRREGLSVTYQRIVIYKALSSTKTHPSAEMVYRMVKKEYPSISLATVYKNLETLADHGIIAKVTPLHDLARFDADTNLHHHLVCVHCKKIIDIHDTNLNEIEIEHEKAPGFQVLGYQIQFVGVCNECAVKQQISEAV